MRKMLLRYLAFHRGDRSAGGDAKYAGGKRVNRNIIGKTKDELYILQYVKADVCTLAIENFNRGATLL